MARLSIAGSALAVVLGLGGTARASLEAEAPKDAGSRVADASTQVSPSADVPWGGLVARPLGSIEEAPMGYLEYLPPGYGDGEPRPLLVFLHGAGEAGDGSATALELVDDLGIPRMIATGAWPDEHPFVILSPQYGTGPASGDCAVADDIAAFLDFASRQYEVDASRTYLTGISCGAIGIWDYLAAYGGADVAAVVPIAGHAEWALEEAGCAPLTDVPVWAFHGAKDEVVPVVHIQGPIERIRSCDGARSVEMELTVYPDADHFEDDAWTRTYDLSAGHDIYAWLLKHQVGPSESP